jgi:hypothetical protein
MKCDLDSEREVETSRAQAFANEWGVQFFEASAKCEINITEVYVKCVIFLGHECAGR